MTLSNGEVGSLIQRASRGAGLPWGLADEAARNARWLHRARQPVLDWFYAYLDSGLAATPPTFRVWTATADTTTATLCPLRCGALLLDQRDLSDGWLPAVLAGSASLTLPVLAAPALLLPALGRAIAATGEPPHLTVDWPGHRVIVTATQLHWIARSNPLTAAAPRITSDPINANAQLSPGNTNPVSDLANPASITGLEHLAHRTTVPASEQSRAGAGEGTFNHTLSQRHV